MHSSSKGFLSALKNSFADQYSKVTKSISSWGHISIVPCGDISYGLQNLFAEISFHRHPGIVGYLYCDPMAAVITSRVECLRAPCLILTPSHTFPEQWPRRGKV